MPSLDLLEELLHDELPIQARSSYCSCREACRHCLRELDQCVLHTGIALDSSFALANSSLAASLIDQRQPGLSIELHKRAVEDGGRDGGRNPRDGGRDEGRD